MIAGAGRHYDSNTLRQLLDEDLPRDRADRVEVHLGECKECRNELENLAGQRHWWNETVDVLSESTQIPKQRRIDPAESSRCFDASLDWIRPLIGHSLDKQSGIGRLDQYHVHEIIGQGGMGVVLRGIDPELNRPVAIKVLAPHLAGVGAARARFMREAQAAAAIVHPAIVPIYSVVTQTRLPYIVMPCIGGGNLQQRIERDGPLEITELLRIGLQIAEGLSAAHRCGVIHRDIKPANILIEESSPRVLISDFGLARALDDASLTNSGMIAGTPQYMSPEQARGEAIDARSDLFSLGSLLYALATGRPPFRAESPLAVLRKISETKPRPIQQVNEQLPGWLERLVGQLMCTPIDQRICSAERAASLLRDALAHVRDPAGCALPSSLTQSRSRRRRRVLVAAGALGLSALAVGFASMPPNAALNDPADAKPQRTMQASPPAQDPPESYAWHDPLAQAELLEIQGTLARLASELEVDSDAIADRIDQQQP